MIKIYDGREEFYQWDLDQKFIVTDPDITEVHYFNHTTECAPICEIYEEDGKRVVNIPNFLFQRAIPIRAYLYNGCCTKGCEEFVVQRKPKPDDYVYTETEVKSWEDLRKLLVDFPTKVSAFENDAGYVTAEELSEAIANIPASGGGAASWDELKGKPDFAKVATSGSYNDLTDKPAIPSTAGLATEKYVDDAVAGIEIPSTEGLATEKYVDDAIATAIASIPIYNGEVEEI